MVLLAILLGAAFAWLVEVARSYATDGTPQAPAEDTTQVARTESKKPVPFAVFLLVLVAFLVLGAIVVCGGYGWITGKWSWRSVIWLNYLTLPRLQAGVVGFVLGALVTAYRAAIFAFLADLAKPKPPSPPKDAKAEVAATATPAGPSAPAAEAKGPYPWLTSIVGIAAVAMVAVVALVIFFPELLTRVESIKVAGVEARFATAASRTFQVSVQIDDKKKLEKSIFGWSAYHRSARRVYDPTHERVTRAEGPVRTEGHYFLRNVALPLAAVIECYAKDLPFQATEMQPRAVRVADEWGRVFEKDEYWRAGKALKQTFELIYRIEEDLKLSDRLKDCRKNQDVQDKLPERFSPDDMKCESGCERDSAFNNWVQPALDRLWVERNIRNVRTNGLAISFITHLFLFTHTPARALEFMDKSLVFLDTEPETLLGQFNFFVVRADLKSVTRAPLFEIDSDLVKAVNLADQIIACIDDAKAKGCRDFGRKESDSSPPREDLRTIAARYSADRVVLINNRLYNIASDWLSGRHLRPSELAILEGTEKGGLAYDLSEWLGRQPLGLLLEQATAVAFRTVTAAALVNDTLALREIAVGASKNDLTKERCARIPGFLATAERIYLKQNDTDQLRLLAEHRKLYENACPS